MLKCTKDLIPTGFKELSKDRTLAKLGYNIDKSLSFRDPAKVEAKKKDDKEKEEKKEDKEKKETTSNSTPTSPPPILKPVAPGENSD